MKKTKKDQRPASSMTKAELAEEIKRLRRKVSSLHKFKAMYNEIKGGSREETAEYEKLAALGRFTANVAPEIRNPITVIGGIARRMILNAEDRSKNREYLKIIVKEARRLEDVLTDAITFSGKGIFHRTESDINSIVKSELEKLVHQCGERGIKVEQKSGRIPSVYVDKKEVGEAIFNIIENAVDAMGKGGTLTIATEVEKMSERDYVTVNISDTGEGIPEEKIKVIFEPFFSTKVDHQDTGLGLPIAKKTVEVHGGFIKVKSQVGMGTTFSLYFPFRGRSKKRK
ncbi:MAG: hypothetical protein JSV21_08835 [Nitrospirota bacterium]|nr:MAG: hypothetical protein JSV21_08835 [Nitrospirota bacterium]